MTIEHLCQVCGEPLLRDLVQCPSCETPHHRDCWDYNRGCSIYGCGGVSALPAPEPASDLPTAPGTAGGTTAGDALARVRTWLRSWLQPAAAAPSLPGFAEEDTLTLEKKEVARLLGTDSPAVLAQAYALFEQRHPRDSLHPSGQRDAALELLGAGYRALGLEALDKAVRRATPKDGTALLELRARTLADDPAYLEEALRARAACPGQPTYEELLARHEPAALRGSPENGEAYLASLLLFGWPPEDVLPLSIGGPLHSVLPEKGHLLSGPFEARATLDEARRRWRRGLAAAVVGAAELDLPPTFESVRALHLSSREARFETEKQLHTCPWEQVRAVHYSLIHTSSLERKEMREAVRQYGPLRPRTSSHLMLNEDFEPVLEVHVGSPVVRIRVDRPDGRLFEYLGRRRTLSHDRNIVLAVKDLVRFAPAARFGHGVLGMLMEQAGAGTRFTSLEEFEEYLYWFHGLGCRHRAVDW